MGYILALFIFGVSFCHQIWIKSRRILPVITADAEYRLEALATERQRVCWSADHANRKEDCDISPKAPVSKK